MVLTLISEGLGLQRPSSTSILKVPMSNGPSARVNPAPVSTEPQSLLPMFMGEKPMMCCSRDGGVGNIWCRSAAPTHTHTRYYISEWEELYNFEPMHFQSNIFSVLTVQSSCFDYFLWKTSVLIPIKMLPQTSSFHSELLWYIYK